MKKTYLSALLAASLVVPMIALADDDAGQASAANGSSLNQATAQDQGNAAALPSDDNSTLTDGAPTDNKDAD